MILSKINNWILFCLVLFSFSTCTLKEQFEKGPDTRLKFTTDTVLFDTVFTRIGSVTRRFLVHNDYNKSVKISSIRLGGGNASPFRINIDGNAVDHLSDYTILPHDSIYIFVDVTIDPNDSNTPFIVKDSILFETNGNLQDVKLVAFGKNAHYLTDSVLNYNATWNNDKPYVIYNSILIGSGHKLTINPGVKIFSYGISWYGDYKLKSRIFVNGSLEVNGTTENPVIMQGIREESYYKDQPGQWGGVWISRGSSGNYFKNLRIRNAEIGIECDSLPVTSEPNLILENVKIENMSTACLYLLSSHVRAFNCIFDNSCEVIVQLDYGGNLELYNCTLGNSSCQCTSHYPALICNNKDNRDILNDLSLTIYNSIIWGDMGKQRENEILIMKTGSGKIGPIDIEHTLIKTTDSSFKANANILNTDPRFTDPCKYNYKPDSLSITTDKGLPLVFLPLSLYPQLSRDINGKYRSYMPDLGAIESR